MACVLTEGLKLMTTLPDKYPPDKEEFTPEETKEYLDLLNRNMLSEALNLKQQFYIRHRLNSLNRSSKRIEKATIILLASTVLLFVVAVIQLYLTTYGLLAR